MLNHIKKFEIRQFGFVVFLISTSAFCYRLHLKCSASNFTKATPGSALPVLFDCTAALCWAPNFQVRVNGLILLAWFGNWKND